MRINRMRVSGNLGFDYIFGDTNILLGTNESGKTTFVNLMLYGLGAKIGTFINEISTFDLCEYVYLDITTKSKNSYQIVRKLPDVDSVTIIPYNEKMELQHEDIKILNLNEYSDFLLDEELYTKVSIPYSATQSATLTYRFLLRTALVDQFTSPTKILASVQGDKNDFMNNQELLNTAIIEQILNSLNQDLHRLRLEYKKKEKERNELNGKIKFYKDFRDELKINEQFNFKKIEKLDKELEKIRGEKAKLNSFKYEQLQNIEKCNDKESFQLISNLRTKIQQLKSQKIQISFEIEDLKKMIPKFENELENIKRQLISQKVLLSIPVTICPVCFSKLSDVAENGLCKHCKDSNQQEVLDGIASYKRTIEETIKEINILLNAKNTTKQNISVELSQTEKELFKIESEHFKNLKESTETINNIINEIQTRIQSLVEMEYQLNEIRAVMIQQNLLKNRKDDLTRTLEEIKSEIEDCEKKSGQDAMKFIMFENTYKQIFENIYGVEHKVVIQKENYMPIIDDTPLSQNSNHSASIKVVARLAYILTLYVLNHYLEKTKINNMKYVIFDSPREKDLDIDKYKRFLEIIKSQNEGQVFLTGSYKDIDTFNEVFPENEGFYIDCLTDDSKLLKNIVKNEQ